MEWYSLRVISGKEKKIKEVILFEVSQSDYSEMVEDVLVPTENIIEMKEGKKKIRERVFFPGYLLIKMDITKESKYLVENINGVINFIGSRGEAQPLKPEEISRIIGVVEGSKDVELVAHPFKTGDAVKVIDGPFLDFSGFVQEVNTDKQKLKVSVSIFGRPTPIELDYLQVELEK
jgi:transcriptional antiterminator NusG